jgi:DNA-binding transcriptional regulator GbsR (MarR family)
LATTGTTITPADTTFEKECVLFFADIVQVFGVPKSVGQIYGLLYASPEPLGFADIVERLEISKGSASQGLQVLRDLGAIVEAESGNARATVYEPELSLRQLVTGVLRERVAPMAESGLNRLKTLKALAEQAPLDGKFYLGRAKQLEIWRKRLNTVLPLLTTLLGPKKKTK